MQNLIKFHIAVVAFNDFGLRLDGTDNLTHFSQFLLRHLRSLVQQDDVTELNLLNDQILNIFLVNVLAHQVVAVAELVAHAQRINYGHNAVELEITVFDILRTQRRNIDNGLCNRCRFTDTTCLNDDVVEAMHGQNVLQLLHQVHL